MQFQQTLKKEYTFEGKGLHTGKVAKMTVAPAPVNTGIVFVRTDISSEAVVEAVAENVSSTARGICVDHRTYNVCTYRSRY